MFHIGDKIVYPMHGAGIIEKIEKKEILGEIREYFIIRMPIGDMKVMVPVSNVYEVGVRFIIDENDIESVIEILRDKRTEMPQNWNRRYRMNMEKIKTGDINEIAEVVRNLAILDDEKGLSTGERKMLGNARQMLLSELVLASGREINEVEEIVTAAIKESEVKG
ncbi:MAG: CarD family transcriptional regulator [Gudongella sp.]|nr:CarD family transcriptional regulator [Gudongella sp.]